MLPFDPHYTRSVRRTPLALAAGILLALLMLASPASAQLSGTYTVGGASPNFATMDAAVTALNGGVTGPVTFRIRSGTYVPPSGGWRLFAAAGMNATNTVTFKPDAGATVTLAGNTGGFNLSAVFTFDGGAYYIIDGSNTTGGTSKDMTIIQTEVNYNSAILFKNNSDNNVVKNCNLQSNASSYTPSYGVGTVWFAQGTSNDNNVVQNCTIGDPTGTNRGYMGVGFYGSSLNSNNKVIGCDILNFRYAGIWVDGSNSGVFIQKNQIHMTMPAVNNSVYAIYINQQNTAQNVSIDSNRIYKMMATLSPSAFVYGIYDNAYNCPSGTTQITNNMISMADNGYIYYYGIYTQYQMSTTSTAYTTNIYNNSIYVGGQAESFASTYMIYRYSYSSAGVGTSNVNLRGNVLFSTRYGSSTSSYMIYNYASPSGGWSSNYNLINVNSDVNTYTAYHNFSLYSTLASYQTSGQDVNSVGSNPQFIDAVNGDLHISATARTPVESRGTPVAGQTTDFDGQARNAATPDIGADEGNFQAPLAIDGVADRFQTPAPSATIRSNTTFSPVGWVNNNGTSTQTIAIRYRILNSGGGVVYNDLQNYSIAALTSQRVTFNQTGNAGGSTSLPAGTYTMELSATVTGDGDASNNLISAPLYVKDQLNGVYTINKTGVGARNYTSFTATVNDLNAVGVSGPVTFNVASGTYDSTTETFPLKFKAATGVNSTNKVTYKADANAAITITSMQAGAPIIDLNDADYFTFDGSNTVGGTSRDWKVINSGAGPAFRMINAAQYNTVKNMVLMANNPTSSGQIGTFYLAGYGGNATGNSYNTIQGNTIGDSAGIYRSFVGLYMFGDFSYRNVANVIDGNDVINFGVNGLGGGYGIYYSSYNDQVKIFRNRVTQTQTNGLTTFNSVYGIFVTNFYNTNDTIAYNSIYGLQTPTLLSVQVGIYISSLGQTSPEAVHNNMITLSGDGGNLYGIYVTASSPATVNLDHNSVSIRGNNTTGSNYLSAAIRTTSSSNVTIRNSIIMNERAYPSGTGNYALYRGSSSGTFASSNNILYAPVTGTAIGYNYGSTYTTLPLWQSVGYDGTSMVTLPPFVNQAAGNLHINTTPVYAGEGQGLALGYTRDIDNQQRDLVTPDIGADEGDFNGGGLKLTYPNGNETFAPGDVVGVTYTTNRIMAVRIEMTINGGSSWTTLASVNPTVKGGNVANVTLPNQAANQAQMRVISQRNAYEADTSDLPFRIIRKLRVTAANGGETWYAGDTAKIRWERFAGEGLANYVDVEYSTDGGTNWRSVATQVPMYRDSLEWVVPNAPTNNARIRLTNREAARFWDSSDASFTIVTPGIQVVTPNGGEKYELNQAVTVNYTGQNLTTLAVMYSSDNGSTWQTIATNVSPSGTYTFTPNAIPTKLAMVRLVDQTRPRIMDESNLPFEIMEAKSIAVYTPSLGDKLVRNSSTVITWDAPRVNAVNISYSSNAGGTWQTVATNVTASEGSRVWTVPNQTTKQGMIRLQEVGGAVIGESNIFWIVDPLAPTITVTAPNGGEQYTGGQSVDVTWTSNDVQNVTIYFSDNNGTSWTPVQSNVPANSSPYKWTVPDIASTNCLVKVSSNNPVASDQSNAVFTIAKQAQPKITVLYPNGNENLTIDSTVTVRWTAQDITGNVKIELQRGASAQWDSIATAPASAGQYTWVVAGPATKEARLRVNKPGLGINDISDTTFEISNKVVVPIVVTYPNGGEQLKADSVVQITWTAPGSVTSVDLEYSTNGGSDWTTIKNDVASAGTNPSYTWTVPALVATSQSSLIRVKDHAGVTASDVSDAVFTILQKTLGFESPVAGMRSLNLLGNFPNPFAGWTEVRWQQGVASDVEIRVYQQSGALVGQFAAGRREAGEQRFIVSGSDLASGSYIYEIRAGREVARGVMVLVR